MIQIDEDNRDLANKILEEGTSPNSVQSHPGAVINEEIKQSIKQDNFFRGKIPSSNSTSHDDLHRSTEQEVYN